MAIDLARIRQHLERTRADLAHRLVRIRRDSVHGEIPLAADAADRAQERENDEVLARLDAATEILVAQYDHALARLDAGHYGRCEQCGAAIGPERLAAVPQATTCASCAGLLRESGAA